MKMLFEEKKLVLITKLLERQGIQKIVDSATDLFENPLIVIDTAFCVLAYSKCLNKEKEPGASLTSKERIEKWHIKTILESGDLANSFYSSEQFVRKYSFFEQVHMAMRIMDVDDPLGHVVMVEEYRSFNDVDLELIKVLAQVLSCEILCSSSEMKLGGRYYSFMAELIHGKGKNTTEVMKRAKSMSIRLPKEMYILVLETIEKDFSVSLNSIRKLLTIMSPELIAVLIWLRL